VEALASDSEQVTDRGILQVVDNQVDPATGTVKLKAEFPNASLQLWSGQFVNVRMLIDTLQQVVVVPTAAVQRGPDGPFVFVVRPGDTVAVRKVGVTQQDDTQAVIATGVQGGEQIVTTGFAQLADGTRVQVTIGDGSPPPPVRIDRRRRGTTPPDAAPGTAANPPAGATRPSRQQRSSTGAAASPAP
jgi:multidrug efflux system membrane fusion protein